MFRKQGFPFEADTYLNVYSGCLVGCEFCKFNQNVTSALKTKFNPKDFKDKRVLISYSTEPLLFEDCSYTQEVIKQLHNQNAKLLFLSRFPKRVIKILDDFSKEDIIGVSVSEYLSGNKKTSFNDVKEFLKQSKQKGLKTWLSCEPILTFDFAKSCVDNFLDLTDFLRFGKLDGTEDNIAEWLEIKTKLEKYCNSEKIYIKECV